MSGHVANFFLVNKSVPSKILYVPHNKDSNLKAFCIYIIYIINKSLYYITQNTKLINYYYVYN